MSLVLQDELLISPKTKEQVIQNTADIRAIEEKIKTGVYKFKGTVEKYSDLPKENVEIGDVYDVKSADKKHGILAGDNVCWDGEDWDNLGSFIDLEPYALVADLELEKNTRVTADNGIITDLNKEIQDRTNADSNILESLDTVNTNLTNNITTVSDNLTTESTTRQTNDTKIINNIWSNSTMSGGYFKTKNTQADTSYGQLWNENSGGGIQYYNKPENILSFVGVNKSSASDMVDVQIYAKDKTSNIGTRVNVSATEGMYYLKNCKNLGFPAEREVAVISDINTLDGKISSEENTRIEADNSLSNLISQEEASRIEKDYKLSQEIITEVNRAEAAEENLDDSKANKSDVYTKAETDTKDENVKRDIYSHIWSNVNNPNVGYFKTKYNGNDGSYALLFNETDGGGSQYYNKSLNSLQYVGTNDGNDGVYVQIYAKDKTTNIGARLAASPSGIFYTNGKANGSYTSTDEIITKANLNSEIALINSSLNEKANADNVYTKAEINAKLSSAMHFMGTKQTYGDLPNNPEIGDMWNILDTGINYAWDGENWDKLSETIDLTPYALKSEVNEDLLTKANVNDVYTKQQADAKFLTDHQDISNLATKDELGIEITNRETFDNTLLSKIWSKNTLTSGYFKTVNTQTDTSYSQIWNENSGGGIQYYNNPRNRLSFVGVNKSSDSDEVDVQIYTKDKTSNIGTRINVSASKGMFYLKDCTNLGFPEEREVAVKEDLPDMSKYLTAAQIKSGYASKWDAIQTAMDFTDACWGGLTDKFWSTSSQDAGVGYFITKKIESDKSYSMLSNNTQVVLQNSNKTTGNVATVIVNSDGAYYTKNTENTTYTSNDELITRKEYNELLLRIEALENNAS